MRTTWCENSNILNASVTIEFDAAYTTEEECRGDGQVLLFNPVASIAVCDDNEAANRGIADKSFSFNTTVSC